MKKDIPQSEIMQFIQRDDNGTTKTEISRCGDTATIATITERKMGDAMLWKTISTTIVTRYNRKDGRHFAFMSADYIEKYLNAKLLTNHKSNRKS